MTDADDAMGRVVAGRYVIGRVLGSGTMGTVRAALDLDLDLEVAIKFVNVDQISREEAVERFRREVQVAARIRSEHVVRVLDTGSLPDGMPFMVMELLQGRGLDEERNLRGVFPVDEAVGYILPAIEVLAEVHVAGVVHRDLKPENLFLEDRAPGPSFVKVLDFGVSKSSVDFASVESSVTQTGTIMGSPLYMAPEQLRSSNSVDARADIWSLGAILFELVTGFTAHEGDSVAEVCASLLRDPPRPITDFGSELPLGFTEAVMRCLEPDRERRYSNVAELGVALLPFAPSGAVHVGRARRLLARSATDSLEPGELAPSSDVPVTVHVGGVTEESGDHDVRGLGRTHFSSEQPSNVGARRIVRVAIAFTFFGLGIGTAFLIEFPRHTLSRRAVAALSRPAATQSAPEQSPPLAPSAPEVAPSPTPSASASDLARPALGVAPKRLPFEPRPLRKTGQWWRRSGAAHPEPTSSVEVTDFGGRR